MAAPSGTTWGNVITGSKSTRKGKIGIYVTTSNTETITTVSIQVWYWSMYSLSDTNNTLYANWGVKTATTSQGAKSISCSVNTGSGWSTSNQVLLASYSNRYKRETYAQTGYFAAKITGIDSHGASNVSSHYVSFPVPALPSYAVKYNANGGSGAPSNQTKYYGKNLTLSSTKPTRTGYSFQYWNTNSSGTGGTYNPGGTWSANYGTTLYAIWKANTYTVKYDANGGSGAPSNQTKTYGVTLKLSSTVPTRQYYNFLGWSTSKTATSATYAAGGNYTANSGTTLYAVWELAYVKPRIENVTVGRCNSLKVADDNGTYALVSFDWACDFNVTGIKVEWKQSTESEYTNSYTVPASGKSGSKSVLIGSNDVEDSTAIHTEYSYNVRITVTDTEYTTVLRTIAGFIFPFDVRIGGNGVGLGKKAELKGVADIAFKTRMLGGILHPVLEPETDLDTILTPNTYVGENVSKYNYGHCPLTSGTFALEVVGMGDEGQVKQRLTYCHKTASRTWERIYYSGSWNYDESTDPDGGWICVSDYMGTLLWSGASFMHGTQEITLSESITKQPNGVRLIFSSYSVANSTSSNSEWVIHDIPKYMIINHPSGGGYSCNCCTAYRNAIKYLYITDTTIRGHENNDQTVTIGGITYTNNGMVLRYVIGY